LNHGGWDLQVAVWGLMDSAVDVCVRVFQRISKQHSAGIECCTFWGKKIFALEDATRILRRLNDVLRHRLRLHRVTSPVERAHS
jgi:hypothetical protein